MSSMIRSMNFDNLLINCGKIFNVLKMIIQASQSSYNSYNSYISGSGPIMSSFRVFILFFLYRLKKWILVLKQGLFHFEKAEISQYQYAAYRYSSVRVSYTRRIPYQTITDVVPACQCSTPSIPLLKKLRWFEVVWSGLSILIRHSLDTPLQKIEAIWGGLVWRIHFDTPLPQYPSSKNWGDLRWFGLAYPFRYATPSISLF